MPDRDFYILMTSKTGHTHSFKFPDEGSVNAVFAETVIIDDPQARISSDSEVAKKWEKGCPKCDLSFQEFIAKEF